MGAADSLEDLVVKIFVQGDDQAQTTQVEKATLHFVLGGVTLAEVPAAEVLDYETR